MVGLAFAVIQPELVSEKFRAKEYQSFGNLVASLSKFSPV